MSEKESITTLLTLLESRQARLTAACKEIADWVDHQGGHPTAVRIRDRLNDIDKDAPSIQSALTSLKPADPLYPSSADALRQPRFSLSSTGWKTDGTWAFFAPRN